MKNGNWIPIDKNLAQFLPRKRAFTKLEAAFSLTLDHENGKPVTVSGYASRWGWSRNKVINFLKTVGAEIDYQEDSKIRRNQKGHIAIHKQDIKRANKGQIRVINNKEKEASKDINRTYKEHKKDISKVTTNKTKDLRLKTKSNKHPPNFATKSDALKTRLKEFGCKESCFDWALKEYSLEALEKGLEVLADAGKVKDPNAFIFRAIKEGWEPRYKPKKTTPKPVNNKPVKKEEQKLRLKPQPEFDRPEDDLKRFIASLPPEDRAEFMSMRN